MYDLWGLPSFSFPLPLNIYLNLVHSAILLKASKNCLNSDNSAMRIESFGDTLDSGFSGLLIFIIHRLHSFLAGEIITLQLHALAASLSDYCNSFLINVPDSSHIL